MAGSAAKTVRIEVTERDIALGKRHSIHLCPIARAVRRATGKRYCADSGGIFTFPAGKHKADFADNSRPAKFVLAFDQGREVRPFTFTVKLEGTKKDKR